MICEKAMELMSADLDHELSESERQALQAHLDQCADCRRLYEAMASIDKQVAGLAQPAPAGLKQGVMYRIGQEAGGKAKKRGFFGVGTGIGLVAAVLALLVGTGVIPLPEQRSADKSAPDQSAVVSSDAPQYGVAAQGDSEEKENAAQWLCPNTQTEEAYGNSSGWLKIGLMAYDRTGELATEPPETKEICETSHETDTGSAAFSAETEVEALLSTDGDTEPDRPIFGAYNGETAAPDSPDDAQLAAEPTPVTDELRELCLAVSVEAEAPVLLYTEFEPQSLLTLLWAEEPKLYEAMEVYFPEVEEAEASETAGDAETELPPVNTIPAPQDGLIRCSMDWQTALALQEWLISRLPLPEDSEQTDEARQAALEARRQLDMALEQIDPGSETLYRVITFPERDPAPIPAENWPEAWPEDWPLRLLRRENWALFFPEEDYVPHPEGSCLLVFPASETEETDAAPAE